MNRERDRDSRGRARNARPRDRLGRPLPRGRAGVEPRNEDESLSPTQALVIAQQLFDTGFPFQAHEVLEGAWKSASDERRPLWQGLAQLAVGVTHAERGNARGAVTLLLRAEALMSPYIGAAPHDIDVAGLIDWSRSAAALLGAAGDGSASLEVPQLVRS